jgi:hypothetical protein
MFLYTCKECGFQKLGLGQYGHTLNPNFCEKCNALALGLFTKQHIAEANRVDSKKMVQPSNETITNIGLLLLKL